MAMSPAAQARLAERRSPDAARRIFTELVPARQRSGVAAAFASSIRHAHRVAPAKWCLRLDPDSIMLKVGFVEVLQVQNGWFHELVLRSRIPPEVRRDERFEFNAEPYRRTPGCDTCDADIRLAATAYASLHEAHRAAIDAAARTPRRTDTIPTHSPGLVVFLADLVGRVVPQPEYLGGNAETFSVLPEEIPPSAATPEGAVLQVLVNRYERSPENRRLCIAHHGTACAVCGLQMADRYGPNVAGLIHVHHLTPVSELGDRAVDPVRDLRPVCPNCHAVIHSGLEPRSIEEVRSMLL